MAENAKASKSNYKVINNTEIIKQKYFSWLQFDHYHTFGSGKFCLKQNYSLHQRECFVKKKKNQGSTC